MKKKSMILLIIAVTLFSVSFMTFSSDNIIREKINHKYKNFTYEINKGMSNFKNNTKGFLGDVTKEVSSNIVNKDDNSESNKNIKKITINSENKEDILNYCNHLSAIDYARVNDYLNNSSLEDLKLCESLMEKRIKEEDFVKIKKIVMKIYKDNNLEIK